MAAETWMEAGCRVDVWLWRARFCKTRTLAARLAESGRIRLSRDGRQVRLEKASRTVKPGDELMFALDGRLRLIRVMGLGERRGPPAEARGLYAALDSPQGGGAPPESTEASDRSGEGGGQDDPSPRH